MQTGGAAGAACPRLRSANNAAGRGWQAAAEYSYISDGVGTMVAAVGPDGSRRRFVDSPSSRGVLFIIDNGSSSSRTRRRRHGPASWRPRHGHWSRALCSILTVRSVYLFGFFTSDRPLLKLSLRCFVPLCRDAGMDRAGECLLIPRAWLVINRRHWRLHRPSMLSLGPVDVIYCLLGPAGRPR